MQAGRNPRRESSSQLSDRLDRGLIVSRATLSKQRTPEQSLEHSRQLLMLANQILSDNLSG
jgi:hypothetical protein